MAGDGFAFARSHIVRHVVVHEVAGAFTINLEVVGLGHARLLSLVSLSSECTSGAEVLGAVDSLVAHA